MRLGIGSYALSWAIGVPGHPPRRPLSAVGLVEAAAARGVRLVQICDNLPLHTLSEAQLEELSRRARELGVGLQVGTRGIRPDHLRVYLRLAVRLGTSIVRTVVDTRDFKPSPEDVIRYVASVLLEYEANDVCLAIENHDRFDSATVARIVRTLDSEHVGVCLDTVNSFGALEGPDVVIETLMPLTVSVHVKDFSVERVEHQMGFVIEGRPAGQGSLQIRSLLERLSGAPRGPDAILELWVPPEPTLEETIAKEQSWLDASVAFLSPLVAEVSARPGSGREPAVKA